MNNLQSSGILVGIAWMFPAAALYLVIRRNQGGTPTIVRLAMAWVISALAVCVFAGAAFAIWRTPRRLHGQDYAVLVLWFAQILIWAGLCRFTGQRLRKERGKDRTGKQVSFFWQGVLILLPMAGLACFGLYSLREDRALAEEEARESGQILAQRLAQAASIDAVQQLRAYRETSYSLHANRTADLGQSEWEGGAATENAAWVSIQSWQHTNTGIDLFSLPPADGFIKIQPEPLLLQPPTWLEQLNSKQEELWRAVQQAEFIAHDLPAAQSVLQKFIDAKPPEGARANAAYLLLLAKTRDQHRPNAITQFTKSQWAKSDQLTDAGLPVGQLICYQALRLMRDGVGVADDFVRTIGWAIACRPSIFASRLVAEAERVARGTNSETNVLALKGWWEADETAREVLEDFREQYPPNTWTNAAYWVDSSAGEYLLTLDRRNEAETNAAPAAGYGLLMFPRMVVDKALGTAVNKADILLPAYARVEFEMAGEKIELSHRESGPAANSPLPVLGEADGKWEGLPMINHACPFRVRVLLADASLLYARQLQRSRLFGGLIAMGAAAALVGFFAARRAFYRQLRLSEMKSNFVSSVSHELRAPIASVRLMAEGLERGKIQGAEKQNEYFRFIVQECRRLSSLIENVLDFSRIEQGRKQYEMESTNLVGLTEQTVKLMGTYAAERQIEIGMEVRGEATPVEIEGKAIQQALVNLMDNAIKHSPKGGRIRVGVEFGKCGLRSAECGIKMGESPTKDFVLLWVEDEGEGIPAAEHEKIFERFYRIGSELRRETQGVGIGLSIVKHIVEAHGGKVTVRSAPGQGSRFTIGLPVTGVK